MTASAARSARNAARLDDTRVRAQTYDAARLAGKPGASSATVAAASARAARTAKQSYASTALAGRSHVAPFPVNAETAYLHGRLVTRTGAPMVEARLRALAPSGEFVSETRTDPDRRARLLPLRDLPER